MFPSSFCFALQYAHLTTYAISLGVSEAYASLVWLCGPVTGMIVQPLIGRVSDSCKSRLGRRRPFIIGGSVFLILSQLLVAFSIDLGSSLGDVGVSHSAAIAIFVASFWIFDAANNVLAISLRALISDIVPEESIQSAFSLQQLWSSLGYIAGYFVSQVDWSVRTKALSSAVCPASCGLGLCPLSFVHGCFDLRISFGISSIITLVFVALVVIFAREASFSVSGRQYAPLGNAISSIPEKFRVIFVASLLSWFGWFSALIYQVHFVSSEVTGQLSSASERKAFFGLMLGSVLSAVVSLLLPWILKSTTHADFVSRSFKVWSLSCCALSIVLIVSPLVALTGSDLIGVAWLASFGLVYAVANSVPYSVLSAMLKETPSRDTPGRLLGLLNVAICLPQIATSLIGGPLNSKFRSDVPTFVLGGICAGIAGSILWSRAGGSEASDRLAHGICGEKARVLGKKSDVAEQEG